MSDCPLAETAFDHGLRRQVIVRGVLTDIFHDLIREACGNTFLADELARLRTLFRTFRDVTWDLELARRDFHRIAVEAKEHLAITDALIAADAKAAVSAMTAHMRSGVTY